MPNYRRSHVPGGTYFFTEKTELNAPIFAIKDHVVRLGSIIREAVTRWAFELNAIVLLPDRFVYDFLIDPNQSTRQNWICEDEVSLESKRDWQGDIVLLCT